MLDFSKATLLTFDCYGTLIDWESGIFSALRPVLAAHAKSISDAKLLAWYGEFEAQAESGPYAEYREVLRSVGRSFGERLGFQPTASELEALPDSAWPYGLVTAGQDAGIVSSEQVVSQIESNRAKLADALRKLGVTVDLWPSA